LVRGENISLNPEQVKTLKRIQGALRLSAHILAKDKTQLVGQLWGRMQCFDVPEIQQLLSQAKQSKTTWLRPLTASLTSPGGRLLRTLAGHSDWVSTVAATPDGKRAISGSWDHTLKVWNLETGEELFTLIGHTSYIGAVAVTSDGKKAISGSWNTLKIWNLETGEEVFTLTGHGNSVSAVALTPDGKLAISGSDDKTLKIWNLETGEEVFTLTGHGNSVSAVALTPDGKRGQDSQSLEFVQWGGNCQFHRGR
jgi:WD40 repeat protein